MLFFPTKSIMSLWFDNYRILSNQPTIESTMYHSNSPKPNGWPKNPPMVAFKWSNILITSYALRIQVCPKKGNSHTILFWTWDFEHQSYSREGSGFLGTNDSKTSTLRCQTNFRRPKTSPFIRLTSEDDRFSNTCGNVALCSVFPKDFWCPQG